MTHSFFYTQVQDFSMQVELCVLNQMANVLIASTTLILVVLLSLGMCNVIGTRPHFLRTRLKKLTFVLRSS